MREARIESRLRIEVRRRGGLALKFISPGWVGAPDRIVIMPGGRVWFVETKAPGKKLRALQEKRRKQLTQFGFQVRVISNLEELGVFIREIQPT